MFSLKDCRLSFQHYIQSKDEKGYATECWWGIVQANLSKERRWWSNGLCFITQFNGPVIVEKKCVAALGFPYQDYIGRRAGGIPRYLATNDELSTLQTNC